MSVRPIIMCWCCHCWRTKRCCCSCCYQRSAWTDAAALKGALWHQRIPDKRPRDKRPPGQKTTKLVFLWRNLKSPEYVFFYSRAGEYYFPKQRTWWTTLQIAPKYLVWFILSLTKLHPTKLWCWVVIKAVGWTRCLLAPFDVGLN